MRTSASRIYTTRRRRSGVPWGRDWQAPGSIHTRSARAPTWLFILAEAESTQQGQRLGELGSHIVDEFLLGSLRCDEASVLFADPADLHGWGPTERIARHHLYSIPELIAYLQANAMVSGQPVRLFSR